MTLELRQNYTGYSADNTEYSASYRLLQAHIPEITDASLAAGLYQFIAEAQRSQDRWAESCQRASENLTDRQLKAIQENITLQYLLREKASTSRPSKPTQSLSELVRQRRLKLQAKT